MIGLLIKTRRIVELKVNIFLFALIPLLVVISQCCHVLKICSVLMEVPMKKKLTEVIINQIWSWQVYHIKSPNLIPELCFYIDSWWWQSFWYHGNYIWIHSSSNNDSSTIKNSMIGIESNSFHLFLIINFKKQQNIPLNSIQLKCWTPFPWYIVWPLNIENIDYKIQIKHGTNTQTNRKTNNASVFNLKLKSGCGFCGFMGHMFVGYTVSKVVKS